MRTNFLSFVHKESLHILRDKRTLLIVLLIPILLMFLFGFAISTEVNQVNVAVVAGNRTEGIRQWVDKLENNPYFSFHGYIDKNDIDEKLRTGQLTAVVVFANDYEKELEASRRGVKINPLVQLIVDAADTNTATASAAYLQSLIHTSKLSQRLFETRMLFNPQMKSAYNFVPGIMGLIFILVCALMTSVSIVREKEMGTLEVLLVSPVNPRKIILSKMIPYFFISLLTLVIILFLARYMLHVPMSGGIAGILAVSVLYLILSLSLGLFVSTLASTQVIAMMISAAVMLIPIVMLSGMIFPIENLPEILQALSCIIPARWYIDAMRKMMIEGLPAVAVWKDILILLVMTLVLIGSSMKKFNTRLE